ncbi:unnamed protein product [Linum tenue]|uniref:FCP1 homology domain-containing protein n=1 Tax=Linum tenue TaxID=586396 RepID=A0AAV0KTN4_9ROSI|nr:unnamed protein product [Linum tenue]
MAELGGGGGGRQQVWVSPNSSVVVEAWRGIVNWLGFLLQLCIQILRGTPSVAQMLLSYVGFGQSLLPAASPSPLPHRSFKRLPVVEVPLQETDGDGATIGDHQLEKLTVVLDLDETLVSAYEKSNLPPNLRTRAIEAGLKWFEIECISDKEIEGRKKINYVTVFERPGLQEFLTRVGEFAHLVLFTAGLEGYARPLVDKIDIENRFCLRLYRPSTVSTEHKEHVKDLLCVSKNLRRVVIVDNNPFSFLLQPLNGIPCVPFSAGQPYDHQLLEVVLPMLRQLSYQKDVRPSLYQRFHMPEWFQMHGIPTALT